MLIQIDITPHSDNRLLKVRAVSGQFCWHGEQRLDGERSPRRVVFDLREMPAGDYHIHGEIIGPTGDARGMVERRVTVQPQGAASPGRRLAERN